MLLQPQIAPHLRCSPSLTGLFGADFYRRRYTFGYTIQRTTCIAACNRCYVSVVRARLEENTPPTRVWGLSQAWRGEEVWRQLRPKSFHRVPNWRDGNNRNQVQTFVKPANIIGLAQFWLGVWLVHNVLVKWVTATEVRDKAVPAADVEAPRRARVPYKLRYHALWLIYGLGVCA